MDSSSEGTTTNSLYASLLKDSCLEYLLPPHEFNPPMDPSLGAIGDERLKLGNIRRLFGYCPEERMSFKDLGKNLPKSNMKDVLFLSVYISPATIPHQGYFELGISVFDTRYLRNGMDARRVDRSWAMAAVQSYHLRLTQSGWRMPPGDGRFNFGSSTIISPEQLRACIEDIVRDRDYALVVSNPHSHVHNLQFIGIVTGLDPLCSIDVVSAYNIIMQRRHTSLRALMFEMTLSHADIHHPGNAAHYNLRALIGLATLDAAKNGWSWTSSLLGRMTFIAKCPEAMFADGYGKAWVDWFFRSHRDAVAQRKVEAKTEHPNTSRKYKKWLLKTRQLFNGQGNGFASG
ncbi:unnamed protein product [Clonostachys solani]|uniref:Gfd2/YDR514C-like C-terminal domain-containing protein n=1 Tax=Clonostachys solani TaxID=160281 RepID=A0A9P0EE22_9HYPO|nr:unnamed protein product [Clonostachys solani]